jgi:putative hemolysin
VSEAAPWVAVIAALFSCFFAACNYALLDFSRRKLAEIFEERGMPERFSEIEEARDGLTLMTGLLRTVSNLVLLVAMIALIAPPQQPHHWGDLLIALVLSGFIIGIVGVAIPVSWSRYAAEPLLARTLPLLRFIYRVLTPVMAGLHLFDPIVRRLLGVPVAVEGDPEPVQQEILDAVSEGEKSGLMDEAQKEMIEAVVDFPSITVDQVMTPRTEVAGILASSSMEDVKRFVADVGRSRIPVYEEDLDHIVGILYVKDLISFVGQTLPEPFDIRKHVREAMFVPETKTVRDLFGQFKQANVHIAIVLDEYGGTAGLVTIEDILEEIVGDIRDEYEKKADKKPGITQLGENTWEVAARVYVDDFNDELKVELPDEEDYDTVGGFVFATLGRIPDTGETFEYDGLRFTIIDAEKTRVNTLRVEMLKHDEVGVPADEH